MASPAGYRLPLAALFLALGTATLAPAALAQQTSSGNASALDPNEGFPNAEDRGDIFSDPSGPLDLIHRAVLMNNMSLSEFREQQSDRISSEAANFRQLQQEAIRQQQTGDVTGEVDPTTSSADSE